MSNKKKFTTPLGVAVFPRVNEPDTKFDAAGVYKCDIALPENEASTQRLMEFLQKRYDAYEAKLTEANNGRRPRMNPVPFAEELDKDQNPTGNIVFKFSSKASGVNQKTGKPWKRDMKLFDASGKPTSVAVWGGSSVKVSFTVGEYKAGVNCGIKCYLEAVQVIELVSGSGGNAGSYGFEAEEGFSDDTPETEGGDAGEDFGNDDADGADF